MVCGRPRVENQNPISVHHGTQPGPKALPKSKLAPITLTASGKLSTKDGTHPPALKEAIVETDKNGAVNVIGLPVCKAGQLQSRDTAAARKACPQAIIGTGNTTVEVALDEQKPILVNSGLTVFNGGTTTFFIHAFFSAPVSGAIVTTVKIKKIHNGRYGLKSVATIPDHRRRLGLCPLIRPEDRQDLHLQRQEDERPLRQMQRRQAAGLRQLRLRRRHQSLGGNRPHLHSKGVSPRR